MMHLLPILMYSIFFVTVSSVIGWPWPTLKASPDKMIALMSVSLSERLWSSCEMTLILPWPPLRWCGGRWSVPWHRRSGGSAHQSSQCWSHLDTQNQDSEHQTKNGVTMTRCFGCISVSPASNQQGEQKIPLLVNIEVHILLCLRL